MPMITRTLHSLAVAAMLAVSLTYAYAAPRPVAHSQSASTLSRWEVLEITFAHPHSYANDFFDVDISVRFVSPAGKEVTIGGFFYDRNTWKARFAPDATGRWTYTYTFRNASGESATGTGAFTVVPGARPGFLRQNPRNPFTWVFDDGTPFWPVGFQEGVGDWNKNGTIFDTASLEGGDRNGPWVASACDMDTYLGTYARAGFNLFRFSQENNTFRQFSDLDHYLVQEGIWTDQLLEKLQDHGYRIFYGFFGYANAFTQHSDSAAAMEQVKRFLQYSVNRWGAYADIWELLNEQEAADAWTTMMADYVHSIDPYRHPVTTSWEHPELKAIDINAPHWYQLEEWWDTDSIAAQNAAKWKKPGKPVVVGEQGNRAGAVWDYTSALRMRIRTWTSLCNEISLVFWNTSYAPNGHTMNIYLGPEERQYIRVLQNFSAHLDAGMKSIPVVTPDSAEKLEERQLRAWGLGSDEQVAVYLRNARAGRLPEHAAITLDVPRAGTGYWISPVDGSMLSSFSVASGRQSIPLPTFSHDLALLVTPRPVSSPPVAIIKANPQFGLAPQIVVLDGRKSAGAFGQTIAAYHWDFGDGTFGDGPVVVHTYPYGSYLATLTVTDAAGARGGSSTMLRMAPSLVTGLQPTGGHGDAGSYADLPGLAAELSRIKQATSANRPPIARASASLASGPAPLALHFIGQGVDVDGIVVRYQWDFGDGGHAATLDANHLYGRDGAYTATLTVWDDRGASGSAPVAVRVGR